MPIFKKKNENFFKKWSPDMAYILGFFCADGAMTINPRGSHYIEFQNTEPGLLEKFASTISSANKVSKRRRNKNWKTSYRLQMGSKQMFKDLVNLGLRPRKADRLALPPVPKKYFKDFVRGYFDGDGTVWQGNQHKNDRKNSTHILRVRFTSASKEFLSSLAQRLKKEASLKSRISLLFYGSAHRLCYGARDSMTLYNFMYRPNDLLFFPRKKNIFKKFIERFT